MKRGNKIYLFRHGKTDYNTQGIFTGFKDSHLTAEGIRNAKEVAKKLKSKQIDVAIYTRLSRSKETLNEVLRYHPECKVKIEDNRMIERSYGILEGTSHKDYISVAGNQIFKLAGYDKLNLSVSEEKELKDFLGKEEYDVIHRGWDISAKNGESFEDVERRVKDFINELRDYVKKNKVNVAISAHGNSIRLFRKIIERASEKTASEWFIPYDKVYEYSF